MWRETKSNSSHLSSQLRNILTEFLVKKYLKLSDADLKLNDKLKLEEIEKLHLAGGEVSDMAAQGALNSNESIDPNLEQALELVLEHIKKEKKKKEKRDKSEEKENKEEE